MKKYELTARNYPTRMHEVLGVKTKELFAIKGSEGQFYLNDNGDFRFVRDLDKWATDDVNPYSITKAVNHGITRRPRLTEEQVRVLEALYEVFDFKWLAKQKDGQVMAYANRPNKSDDWYGCWFSGEGDNEEDYGRKVKASSPVCGLISWSDPAPLDIVQTLKENGIEIEEKPHEKV